MEMKNHHEPIKSSVTPNQSQPIKHANNRRGMSMIIFGGLVLLLVIAVVVFYLGTLDKATPQKSLIATVTGSPSSNTPTLTNDSIDNWKIFNNSTFPFTFQYPNNTEFVMSNNPLTGFTLVIPKNGSSDSYMNLGFEFIKSDKNLKEYATRQLEKSEGDKENVLVPLQEISVNGLVGLTYTAQDTIGLGQTMRLIFVKSPDTNYIVSIAETMISTDTLQFKQTTDQILSTFKFSPKQ